MMASRKLLNVSGILIVLFIFTSCPPPSKPKIEIGTYDILLDYDQEHKTNIAQVYKNTMDRFYDWNPTKDEITEITDTVNGYVFHVFGIRHQSRLTIIRFLRSVLPFINNPREWVFFVEGATGDTVILPEVYFLKGVAKELDIPTFDPIVPTLGKEVTEKLLLGTPPMVTIKDIHFALFNDLFPTPEALHSLSPVTRENYIKMITSYSLFPHDSIKNLLEEYDTEYLAHPIKLTLAQKVFSQIRSDMIDTSNVLSRERFSEQLAGLKNRKHIFICVGSYHLPAFKNINDVVERIYQIHMSAEEEPSTK